MSLWQWVPREIFEEIKNAWATSICAVGQRDIDSARTLVDALFNGHPAIQRLLSAAPSRQGERDFEDWWRKEFGNFRGSGMVKHAAKQAWQAALQEPTK